MKRRFAYYLVAAAAMPGALCVASLSGAAQGRQGSERVSSGQEFEPKVTIEDPKVLTKPWTSAPRQWSLSHDPLMEYYCTINREPEQYQLLKQQGK